MNLTLDAALAYYSAVVAERQRASDTLHAALLPDDIVECCLDGFDRVCDILSAAIVGFTDQPHTLRVLMQQFAAVKG